MFDGLRSDWEPVPSGLTDRLRVTLSLYRVEAAARERRGRAQAARQRGWRSLPRRGGRGRASTAVADDATSIRSLKPALGTSICFNLPYASITCTKPTAVDLKRRRLNTTTAGHSMHRLCSSNTTTPESDRVKEEQQHPGSECTETAVGGAD